MDGQNFENENNVTVDTTAAETVSETEEIPVAEPVNNYQDYTANVQPNVTVEVPKAENNETNVLAIVSLILGILSIVLGCCSGWVGALFGIGGVICAVFANKQGKTGLAKGGLICSIVGIVLGILITILAVIFSVAMIGSGVYGTY